MSACFAALILAGCNSPSTSPQFDFSAESIERVNVTIHAPPAEYSSSDPATLRNILNTLSAASKHADHKCAAFGTLSLRLESGRDVQLKLLPGHEPTTYEFRFQDALYRVPRDRFTAALRAIGVTQLPE